MISADRLRALVEDQGQPVGVDAAAPPSPSPRDAVAAGSIRVGALMKRESLMSGWDAVGRMANVHRSNRRFAVAALRSPLCGRRFAGRGMISAGQVHELPDDHTLLFAQ
ncbi:MAG: hypothetical protein JO310_20915 [Hyphomicrobiales bacterium]|nr:hypothetical protein [Hyphomicrobiales bacterium]